LDFLARSANDLALCMSLISAYDRLDVFSDPDMFLRPMSAINNKTIMVPDNLAELGIDDDIIEDFEQNLLVFRDLGYQLNTFSFDNYDFAAARRAGLLICEADMRIEHADDWVNNHDKFFAIYAGDVRLY